MSVAFELKEEQFDFKWLGVLRVLCFYLYYDVVYVKNKYFNC